SSPRLCRPTSSHNCLAVAASIVACLAEARLVASSCAALALPTAIRYTAYCSIAYPPLRERRARVNKSRLSRDPLSLTILAMLVEKPRHPYEIQRLIRERRKDFAYSTQRTLYHTIDRLVAVGLILHAEVSREGNRPERTVYQITDNGRDS